MMLYHTCNDNSFYRIFTFNNIEHSAFDGGIAYYGIEITKDIPELGLVKGTTYEQANLIFCAKELGVPIIYLINWDYKNTFNIIPNESRSKIITLVDIAPFCKWI